MIVALSAALLLCGLLGLTVFDSGAATCVILCAAGLTAVAARLVLRKKFTDKRIALAVFLSAGLVLMLLFGFTGTKEGILAGAAAQFRAVDRLLEAGKGEEALEKLVEMKKDGSYQNDNTEINLRESAAYRSLDMLREAESALDRCAVYKDARYYMAKASVQLADDKQAEARQTYMEAAALYPRHFEASLNAGYLCFVRGEYTRAEYYLLRACSIAPKNPHSLFFLGSVKFSQGDYAEAAAHLQNVLKLKIDDAMEKDVRDLLASVTQGG